MRTKEPAQMCPAIDDIIVWVKKSDMKSKDEEKIIRGLERLRKRITNLRAWGYENQVMLEEERKRKKK